MPHQCCRLALSWRMTSFPWTVVLYWHILEGIAPAPCQRSACALLLLGWSPKRSFHYIWECQQQICFSLHLHWLQDHHLSWPRHSPWIHLLPGSSLMKSKSSLSAKQLMLMVVEQTQTFQTLRDQCCVALLICRSDWRSILNEQKNLAIFLTGLCPQNLKKLACPKNCALCVFCLHNQMAGLHWNPLFATTNHQPMALLLLSVLLSDQHNQ